MSAGLARGVGRWPSRWPPVALPRELSGTWSRKASFHPSPSFQNPHKQRLPEDLLSSSWKKSPFCGQPTTVGTKCQRQSCPWQRRACVQADRGHPGQRLASSATPWPGSGTRRPALGSCPRSIAGWGVLWGGAPQPLLLHSPETGPVGDPHPPHQAAVRVRVPLLTGMRKQCGQGQRQGLTLGLSGSRVMLCSALLVLHLTPFPESLGTTHSWLTSLNPAGRAIQSSWF